MQQRGLGNEEDRNEERNNKHHGGAIFDVGGVTPIGADLSFADDPADGYTVTITSYDLTNKTEGTLGPVRFKRGNEYQVANTITVKINPSDTNYRVYGVQVPTDGYINYSSPHPPEGYVFRGWKRVSNGQSFEEGEYIFRHQEDYDMNDRTIGSFYKPREEGEKIYAVYEKGNFTTPYKLYYGLQVKIVDEDDNPVEGAQFFLQQGSSQSDYYKEIISLPSGSNGIARTETDEEYYAPAQ